MSLKALCIITSLLVLGFRIQLHSTLNSSSADASAALTTHGSLEGQQSQPKLTHQDPISAGRLVWSHSEHILGCLTPFNLACSLLGSEHCNSAMRQLHNHGWYVMLAWSTTCQDIRPPQETWPSPSRSSLKKTSQLSMTGWSLPPYLPACKPFRLLAARYPLASSPLV